MNQRRRWLARLMGMLLCGVAALGLTGCFEIKQEVWLREDFSGRMTQQIGIELAEMGELAGEMSSAPLPITEEEIATLRAQDPAYANVADLSSTSYMAGTTLFTAMTMRITDMRQPIPIFTDEEMATEAGDALFPPFQLETLPDGSVRLTQPFNLAALTEGAEEASGGEALNPDDEMTREMMAMFFENRTVSYVLHAPPTGQILTASGAGVISPAGGSVTWALPLGELMLAASEGGEFPPLVATLAMAGQRDPGVTGREGLPSLVLGLRVGVRGDVPTVAPS